MEIQGLVRDGVVVPEAGSHLPEGATVTIVCDTELVLHTAPKKRHVKFPLVHSETPGTLNLTNQRIGEILDQEDASPRY
jgi:hypothetical protein